MLPSGEEIELGESDPACGAPPRGLQAEFY